MLTNHVYRVHEDDNFVWDTTLLIWVPMTQPLVNTGSLTVSADVSDRPGRLLGHVTVDNFPATQPVSATDLDIRNLVFATDKVDVSGSTVAISGTVPISAATLPLPTGAATLAGQTQPGVDIGDVTVNNATGAAAVNVQDGGNSLTVDGTVAVSGSVAVTGPLTDAQLRATPVPVSGAVSFTAPQHVIVDSSALPSGAATLAGQTQPGVDIGDVTVNNAAGVGAVNIQDGGNSITVDNPALSVVGGGVEAAALRVTIASDSTGVLSVDDNGGSLTVDTPQLPAALVGGRLDENVGAWLGSTAPTVGQKAMASSLPVVIASDQTAVPVSGTVAVSTAFALEATQLLVKASLDVIDDWDETDRAKVNLIVGQAGVQGNSGAVSANTQRVTLATDVALPAGTNVIGHVINDANSGVDIGDVTINNAAGAAAVNVQDGGNSLTVDATDLDIRDLVFATDKVDVTGSAVTAAVSGTVAVSNPNLQYAEDAASVGGESMTLAGAVRSDYPVDSQSADGDYANLKTDRVGRLRVDAREGTISDGVFFPTQTLGAKLDELVRSNEQVVTALVLMLNVMDKRLNFKRKDLTLN